MAKKSSAAPLLALGALGAGLALVFSSKKASATTPEGAPPVQNLPATPAPAGSASQTVSVNGHTWKLVPVSAVQTDVFAPAGSWGPHGELRVLRFARATTSAPRVLAGAATGVPEAVMKAAMTDLKIQVPAGPTLTTPPGQPPMPASLQQELIAVMMELGVDSAGVVRGPVTAAGIQHATELSSRLEQAGYKEAAATLRGYAQQASKMLPQPAPAVPTIPGVPPDLMAQVNRALQLERDPAKLEALRAALAKLPPSAERDLAIGALDALILQVKTAQVISQTATEIDQIPAGMPVPGGPLLTPYPAPVPSSVTTGSRILKLVSPNMKGDDVKAWQQVLQASGYSLAPSGADGVFGPATDTATKDWQRKRGLTADGDVGPATRAKIGTPPTAPTSVPATASPRPDPVPKTAVQVAADALATHLLALQVKYGVAGSKGKQDTTLVKRFQSAVGGVADGLPGKNTMVALAKNGIGVLPGVMYWSKTATKSKDLPAYRAELGAVAKAARAAGNATLAAQIEASAARETGAGGLA